MCNVKCLSLTWPGMLLAIMIFSLSANATETVSLGSLDLSKVRQDWGQPQMDKSVDGHPLIINGKKFEHGLGTHASSTLYIDLKGSAERFTAFVGIDDEVNKNPAATVVFRVLGDGRELWKSDVIRAAHAAKRIDVSLKGMKVLLLMVDKSENGIGYDHADWADAKIEYTGDRPETIAAPMEKAVILTPPPPATPRINGARVFGVRPDSPFLFTVPVTGRRPIAFSAENLPDGLQIDSKTGRITGAIQEHGEYIVMLTAINDLGNDQRALKIVCGDAIALTPPMGWSSWNCFARTVDDAKVRSAADAMVQNELINHGWSYINIDEGWLSRPNSEDPSFQGNPHNEKGILNPNKKFPDMKALADYIHGKGLKAGIYSPFTFFSENDPMTTLQQQEKDIQTIAEWGFDFYKFNWASYMLVNKDKGLPGLKEVYQVIMSALINTHRDMVFSVCAPPLFSEMGDEIGGNCWLATMFMNDSWSSMSEIGFALAGREQSAKPGHWNNADALVVGVVGDMFGGGKPHPTRLTPYEQYTHISLWCLLSSPLMIGCDLTQLDEFTLSLLTNDEVLEINQDPLGKQARRVSRSGDLEIWAKELEDGSLAVGLFNRGESENKITVNWSELNLSGKQIVRDLWRQKDLGEFDEQFTATVGRHGVALVRLRASGK
jgi:alpha-galactosidase